MSLSTPASAPPGEVRSERFASLLSEFRRRLEAELEDFLEAKERAAASRGAEAAELVEVLRRLAAGGGKRLRPALVYYAFRACGGASDQAVMPLAMASELLHTYLLVHDDIMDRSELRRGLPAAHVTFRERHRAAGWSGDAGRFGEAMAILVGDLAYTYAVELFGRAAHSDEARAAGAQGDLDRCFSATCEEVIGGQALEMQLPFRERPSEEDLFRVLRFKTGRYTVERPMELGARLAGAPADLLAGLRRYGFAAGEAFQLQDDVLGIFGDAGTVGKPVGSDLIEGKFTFLIHFAFECAGTEAPIGSAGSAGSAGPSARLREILGRDLSPAEIAEAQDILRTTGALARVREMIRQRIETARHALDGLEISGKGRDFLAGLLGYFWERER